MTRCQCCGRPQPYCQQCGAYPDKELLCADGYHYCCADCMARHRDAVFCKVLHKHDCQHDDVEDILTDAKRDEKLEEVKTVTPHCYCSDFNPKCQNCIEREKKENNHE